MKNCYMSCIKHAIAFETRDMCICIQAMLVLEKGKFLGHRPKGVVNRGGVGV